MELKRRKKANNAMRNTLASLRQRDVLRMFCICENINASTQAHQLATLIKALQVHRVNAASRNILGPDHCLLMRQF